MVGCILNFIAKNSSDPQIKRYADMPHSDPDNESLSLLDSDRAMITLTFNPVELDMDDNELWVKTRQENYIVFPVLLTDSITSHLRIIEIKTSTSKQKCGWLIPISTILEWDIISTQVSDSFLKRFVDVALWNLLFNEVCFNFHQSVYDFGSDSVTLEEIYPLDTGIVVFFKERIPEEMLKEGDFEPSVKAEILTQMTISGYSSNPARDSNRFLAKYDWNEDKRKKHIILKRFSKDIQPYMETICTLLEEATAISSPVVTFFLLYQVIEEFLSISFHATRSLILDEIENLQGLHDYAGYVRLLTSKPRGALTATDGVMQHLFDFYCKGFIKKRNTDLEKVSKKFLEIISCQSTDSHKFGQTYQVRNEVMHSQAKWRGKEGAVDQLLEVNRCLLLFIGEMFLHLKIEPGKDEILKIWKRDNN